MTITTSEPVGLRVRRWRERRRLSQLQVANEAGVSSRHLSFIETGRSQPSPSMILRLGEFLDVPLRERNTWLLAAGYAPSFSESDLSEVSMSAVSTAVNQVLTAHEPFPAAVGTSTGNWWRRTRGSTCFSTAARPSCSSRR